MLQSSRYQRRTRAVKTEKLHPPKYCPNCGKPIKDIVEYWVDSSRPETPDNPYKGVGYDCYCGNCGWSGCIEPDADREIVHRIPRNGVE